MKITDISQLNIGDVLYDDKEHQPHHIIDIITGSIEPVIYLQHYPSTLWYILTVICNKCGKKSYLKYTSTILNNKFKCDGQIEIESVFYTCGGKQYTEIFKEYTGIKYKNYHSYKDITDNFYLKND